MKIQTHEKEYLVERMRQEIARSNGVVGPEAMQEYRAALEFYQALPEATDMLTSARSSPSAGELNAWLDNMIIDHRFTTSEVQAATGLDWKRADAEVRARALKSRETSNKVASCPILAADIRDAGS